MSDISFRRQAQRLAEAVPYEPERHSRIAHTRRVATAVADLYEPLLREARTTLTTLLHFPSWDIKGEAHQREAFALLEKIAHGLDAE